MAAVLSKINDTLYTWLLIYLLAGSGIYFSIRTRFVQMRRFRDALRCMMEKKEGDKGVSSFQALMIATASRVGTGNMAGVATAIIMGGPGAAFWMWLMAILGSSSAFVESTLAQIYKKKEGDSFKGGPAYYIERALHARWLGIIFAISLIATFAFGFNGLQSYNIVSAFGVYVEDLEHSILPTVIGLILAVCALIIFFAGDIIGKISCLNDWKLSHLINGEYYCDRIADIVSEEVRKTIEHADLFLTRDPLAIQNLMESLVKVGIAMAYVGNSRPASGSEHHLAHFFEITGILNHSPYLSHGIDVAYGTVITSNLRTRLAQMNPTSFVRLSVQEESRKNWEEAIQEVFGSLSTSVISLQEQTGLYQKDRYREVRSQWKNIRKILNEVPDGITVMKILKRMGFQNEEFTQLYGSEKIRKAVEFAKDLKDRYSLLWLLNDVGMLHTMAYEDCVFNGFSDESW